MDKRALSLRWSPSKLGLKKPWSIIKSGRVQIEHDKRRRLSSGLTPFFGVCSCTFKALLLQTKLTNLRRRNPPPPPSPPPPPNRILRRYSYDSRFFFSLSLSFAFFGFSRTWIIIIFCEISSDENGVCSGGDWFNIV